MTSTASTARCDICGRATRRPSLRDVIKAADVLIAFVVAAAMLIAARSLSDRVRGAQRLAVVVVVAIVVVELVVALFDRRSTTLICEGHVASAPTAARSFADAPPVNAPVHAPAGAGRPTQVQPGLLAELVERVAQDRRRLEPQCARCGAIGREHVTTRGVDSGTTRQVDHQCAVCGATWRWLVGEPWPRTLSATNADERHRVSEER